MLFRSVRQDILLAGNLEAFLAELWERRERRHDRHAAGGGVGGATTVGGNFFTLTNPSAITFPRINADNTVSHSANAIPVQVA